MDFMHTDVDGEMDIATYLERVVVIFICVRRLGKSTDELRGVEGSLRLLNFLHSSFRQSRLHSLLNLLYGIYVRERQGSRVIDAGSLLWCSEHQKAFREEKGRTFPAEYPSLMYAKVVRSNFGFFSSSCTSIPVIPTAKGSALVNGLLFPL